jgi:hypothetical protein
MNQFHQPPTISTSANLNAIALPPLPTAPNQGEPITAVDITNSIRHLQLKVASTNWNNDGDVAADNIASVAVYNKELLNAYSIQQHGAGFQGMDGLLQQLGKKKFFFKTFSHLLLVGLGQQQTAQIQNLSNQVQNLSNQVQNLSGQIQQQNAQLHQHSIMIQGKLDYYAT